MLNILEMEVYESDTQSGSHGDRYHKDVALAMFLDIQEKPNLRLGFEVKTAGKFDDLMLIDDKSQVIHFIQIKHSSVKDDKVKSITREALFPKRQGSGDFEITKYLESYFIVRNAFNYSTYGKKFYILTNKVLDESIEENIETKIANEESIQLDTANKENTQIVERSDGRNLLPLFGSKDLTFKLSQDIIKDLRNRVNKDFIEVKNAIKNMFLDGKVSETICKYCTPLKAVLKVDKDKQCSFLNPFILESKKLGNNSLYNVLKEEEFDMTKTVTINVNFLNKNSKLETLPLYVSEEMVKEFISDFSLLVGQPHDLRSLIDSKLYSSLKKWMQPDHLGKITQSDMDRIYNDLEKSFDEASKSKEPKKRHLLKIEEIQKCLKDIRNANNEFEAVDTTQSNEFYINRQIAYTKSAAQLAHKSLGNDARLASTSTGSAVATEINDTHTVQTHVVNRSIGDAQLVKEFLTFEDQQCIILVADPGMGKTSFLKYLAFGVQKEFQFRVFLVYFNALVRNFDGVEQISDFQDVISILGAVLSKENCDIVRNAPRQREGSNFSILLVMDGFDEIHTKYTAKAIAMLKALQEKQSIQIVVSSRMHTQKLLENEFGVQSMFLEPLSKDDQVEFLRRMWNVSSDTEKAFRAYSQELLQNFQCSIPSKLGEICGLPLMMRMLAEIRYEKFKEYSAMVANNPRKEYEFSSEKLNVAQLFEKFVVRCFRIELVEKSGGNFDDAYLSMLIVGYILEHQLLAMKLLDIEIHENLFRNRLYAEMLENFGQRCENGSNKSRLVKVVEHVVQFCHLSYSEFFVAKYLCDNIYSLQVDRIFDVLSKHDAIRNFSMIILNENMVALIHLYRIKSDIAKWACESGCLNIVAFLVDNFESFSITDLSMMLRTSAKSGYEKICELLLLHNANPNEADNSQQTALHFAARSGHVTVVQLLLAQNAEVNSADEDGWTALHMAAEKGNVLVMQSLFYAEAITNPCTNTGRTLLHIAAMNGHEKASEMLINSINNVDALDNGKITALHLAARNGHATVVGLLLRSNADVNALNEHGWTALHMAAEGGNVQVIQAIIKAGAITNSRTKTMRTPLHIAAMNGHVQASKLFIESNIDVDALDNRKCTALHLAACYNKVGTVKLLHEHHANVNACDEDGWTPLHMAAAEGDVQVINVLIEAGAIPNSCTETRKSPLHLAAMNGHKEAAKLFILHGNDVNALDDDNCTALHLAARSRWETWNDHVAVVELLLQNKADLNATSKYGWTALHMAAEGGNIQVIQLLLSEGAATNSRTSTDETPLHIAIKKGHERASEVLIEKDADVNAVNRTAWTPLHLAARCGFVNLTNLLLRHHANVQACDSFGLTALHTAAMKGNFQVIESLIAAGASTDCCTNYRAIPLHLAAMNGHEKAVELLIGHTDDVNARDENGMNALDFAAENGHDIVVELLLRWKCLASSNS